MGLSTVQHNPHVPQSSVLSNCTGQTMPSVATCSLDADIGSSVLLLNLIHTLAACFVLSFTIALPIDVVGHHLE